MSNEDILRLSNTLMSAGLVEKNVKFAKEKKKKLKDFVNMFGENVVGTQLIKAQADMI